MGQPRESRRFKINPVELVVFGAVTLIFANSVYQLFYDWEEIRGGGGGPEVASADENRSLASSTPLFASIEVKCQANEKIPPATSGKHHEAIEDAFESTPASKVRLSGPLCAPAGGGKLSLSKIEVINRTSNANATVITNANEGKFSTDFIQLNNGRNQILLKWMYQGGKEVSQLLVIDKK